MNGGSASSDAVKTCGLKDLNGALFRSVYCYRTEWSVIVMDVTALYLVRFAIQQKPMGAVKHERANTKCRGYGINHLTIDKGLNAELIQVRILRRPKCRVWNSDVRDMCICYSGIQSLGSCRFCGDVPTVTINHRHPYASFGI